MEFTLRLLLSTILLSSVLNTEIIAQKDIPEQSIFNQIYSAAEQEYGIDQELVNGVYFENIYRYSIGHPYLEANIFKYGSVVFRGKKYPDLLLKYDIYNQQLLAIYPLFEDSIIFYLPVEFISEFNIENKEFKNRVLKGEEDKRIYQVIGDEYPVAVIYKWEKITYHAFHHVIPSYAFSEDRKTSFISIEDNLVRYKGNGSFTRKFPEQYRKAIRKYIRNNKIKVRYATDFGMERLIRHINTLYNS